MGDILIIGGGFAGLEAARVLSKKRSGLLGRRVLVVDVKETSDFLPVLPDVAAGRVRPKSAAVDVAAFCDRLGVNFTRGEVARVDPGVREVYLADGSVLGYEFLVISCGTTTNFYGMEDVRRYAVKLDSVGDAAKMLKIVTDHPEKKILIAGGGYTGVEIASHLASMFRRRKIKKYSVSIIEKGEDILGVLPEWMREYARANLSRLKISIHTECSLSEIAQDRAKLSNGMAFEDVLVVWAAGVRAPDFVGKLPFEKDRQGRLKVDASMRCGDGIFAVGDAAVVTHRGVSLRMAVQFSLAEADIAAKNILRSIKGAHLVSFRPLDLGLIVPMANRVACGRVFLFRVKGIVAWLFHYAMCVYRSWTIKNRWQLTADVIRSKG